MGFDAAACDQRSAAANGDTMIEINDVNGPACDVHGAAPFSQERIL
jgi:hypothetical protein